MRTLVIILSTTLLAVAQTVIQPQNQGVPLQQQVTGRVGLNATGGLVGLWNSARNTYSIDGSFIGTTVNCSMASGDDDGEKINNCIAGTPVGMIWDASRLTGRTAKKTINVNKAGKLLLIPGPAFKSSAPSDAMVISAQGAEVTCGNTANNFGGGPCVFATTDPNAHIINVTNGAASVHDLELQYLGTGLRTGGSALKLSYGSGGNFFALGIGVGTWIGVNQAEGGSVGYFENIRSESTGGSATGQAWTFWQMGGCLAAGNPAQLGCTRAAGGTTDVKLNYVIIGYGMVMKSGYVFGMDAGVDSPSLQYLLIVGHGICSVGTACGEGIRIQNTTFAAVPALDRPRWIRCENCLVENSSVNAGGITTEPAIHIKSGRSIHFTESTAMVCGAQCILIEPGALADGAPVAIQDVEVTGMISATAGKEIIKILNSAGDWSAVTTCGLPVCDVKIHHNSLYGAGLAGGIDAVAVAAAGNGGTGYTAGDVVDVIYPGGAGGKVNVDTVDGVGKVLTVSVNAAGTNYPTYVDTVTGGTGHGLQLNITSYGGVYSSIYAAANVKKFMVEHNNFDRMIGGIVQLPKYFVEVAAGTSDQYEISHNQFTAAYRIVADVFDGGTGHAKVIGPNTGDGHYILPNSVPIAFQDSGGSEGAFLYTTNGANTFNIAQNNNADILVQVAGSGNLNVQSSTRAYNSGFGQFNIQNAVDAAQKLELGYDTAAAAGAGVGYIQATRTGVANKILALNPNGGGVTINTLTAPPTDGLRVGADMSANAYQINGTEVISSTRIATFPTLNMTVTAGTAADINFFDGATNKWTLSKQAGNSFILYDQANTAAIISAATTGDLTLGETGKNLTLTGTITAGSLTSGGTQCVQASSAGVLSVTGSGCASAFDPTAPGPIGGTTPNTGQFTALTIDHSTTPDLVMDVSGTPTAEFFTTSTLTTLRSNTSIPLVLATSTSEFLRGDTSQDTLIKNFLQVGSKAFASLGTPADGYEIYCSNCDTPASQGATCTSAGDTAGAWAKRIRGAWQCY